MGTLTVDDFIIICTFLGEITYIVLYHLRRLRLYQQASTFPGPPDILNKFNELFNLYSSSYRVWVGPKFMIFVSQPEHIKSACNYLQKNVQSLVAFGCDLLRTQLGKEQAECIKTLHGFTDDILQQMWQTSRPRFTMMEMKTILATVLRRFVLKKDNIVPQSDMKLKSETMLKPVDPITLRIDRRSWKLDEN